MKVKNKKWNKYVYISDTNEVVIETLYITLFRTNREIYFVGFRFRGKADNPKNMTNVSQHQHCLCNTRMVWVATSWLCHYQCKSKHIIRGTSRHFLSSVSKHRAKASTQEEGQCQAEIFSTTSFYQKSCILPSIFDDMLLLRYVQCLKTFFIAVHLTGFFSYWCGNKCELDELWYPSTSLKR